VRKRGLSLDNFKLQLAILGAEPWTDAIRSQVEAGLGVNATNIYGLSEIIGPGVSQEDFEEKGTGSYIWEDHFYPEIVDKDTGQPLPEGELGVLVFTTLTKVGMPLLRYWTNDITNIYYTHSDKRTHVKMGPIRGRADDMLIIRGVNVFPTQIEELMAAEARLTPYYQLEVSRSGTLDEVLVRLEAGAPLGEDAYRELSGQFRKKIKDNVGITCRVEVCAPGSVPRSEGGKLQRVVDLR
jgi:phenylacetate-CoA ligase